MGTMTGWTRCCSRTEPPLPYLHGHAETRGIEGDVEGIPVKGDVAPKLAEPEPSWSLHVDKRGKEACSHPSEASLKTSV